MAVEHANWCRTGWFGIIVDTPPDWNLGAVSGEETEGYLRVDSPEGEAVEIRWRTRKGAVNLESILEEYFRGLQKNAKKSKLPLEINRKPRALQGIRPAGRKPAVFSWTGDRRALGAVWACPTCDRVVIAQVISPLDGPTLPAASILNSIRDHSEGGLTTWALYDMAARVPEEYKVTKQKLMSGYIRLEFTRRSSQVIVERWGLANIALKDATISEWAWDKGRALNRHYRAEESEIQLNGHPGVLISGPVKGIVRRVKTFAKGIARLSPAARLTTYAWHCPEANRIFMVTAACPRDEETARQVVDSIQCHSGKA